MYLESLGADARIFGAFQPYAAQGLLLARVIENQRDLWQIRTEQEELRAEVSGGFRNRATRQTAMPVVGDWVAARPAEAGQGLLEFVLPRRTLFSRRAPGRREEQQPLAANIDVVFLVCGLDGEFNPRRLERYLAVAAESGAAPVVVLNKADVCADPAGRMVAAAAVAAGSPIVACSAREGTGLERLAGFLAPGRTAALLGSSGAGKSTILNRLLGEERLATGAVRAADSRGRHTTTHRELFVLPAGGALIDTPGLRELQLWAGEESVDLAFEEIAALAASCRYRNCSHRVEPGCAVMAAVSAGEIRPERLVSYHKLIAEARRHETVSGGLEAQERKRKLKQIHKAQRQHYRLMR